MKKVLFLITTLGGGGAEKVLSTIVKSLDKSKYDITVMTVTDLGVYIDEIKKHVKYKGCFKDIKPGNNLISKVKNYIYLNVIKKFIIKHPKLFYKIFIREKYDIEISFLENFCSKIISNSTNRKSKKYLWIHIDLEKSNWVKNQFKGLDEQKYIYGKFDKIFCVSKDVKKSFERLFGLKEKTYVQYNANDINDIEVLSSESINDLRISNRFKFVTAGRFIEQKGYDRLLEAHKRLIDEGFEYELWILGDGMERENYEKFIKINNIEEYTKLLGFKKNPYKYIKQCDSYICSSRMEGYSLVVAESIILEKPIISTMCSGPIELIENGKYGILVENSTDGIYSGMKKIISDKEVYNFYKQKSKERSHDFNLNKIINEIESILDS